MFVMLTNKSFTSTIGTLKKKFYLKKIIITLLKLYNKNGFFGCKRAITLFITHELFYLI